MKLAKTSNEAWDIQHKFDKPSGWIQWKGTTVCMDVHCICGKLGHIDGKFVYSIKCSSCGRCYFVNGHIELIKIEEEPENVKIVEVD